MGLRQELRSDGVLEGPIPGAPLETEVVTESLDSGQRVILSELFAVGGSCKLLVVVSPPCSFCQRMRFGWPTHFQRWAEDVGVTVQAAWISSAKKTTLMEFFKGFSFEGIDRLRITSDAQAAWAELGVLGTPTSILVGRRGELLSVVVGDRFPPADIARESCA